ncbi:hypothetical protein Zmor_021340 [Zophobas morio]|uniref:Uncharacterized protein n=1 Tax=Zophobas morio TaxID=2755281 RepID=A0AA38I555_9CUCU|nr:hypothetical protein Zmor_021340 [Zophobas morio]
MNSTQRRSLRTKKLMQKDDKDSRVSVSCRSWVCSVVFDNGEFYKFRACRHGNAVWGGGWELKLGPRIVDRTLSKSRDSMCANIYVSGTASPRSWYLQPQTHDRGRDRIERRSWIFTASSASYIKRIRPHPYHVDKVQGLEPADCPHCVTHFLSDGTPHSRQQERFQETVFGKRVLVG